MYCNNPFNYLRFPANVNTQFGAMPDITQQVPYIAPSTMNMGAQMQGQMMPIMGQQYPMYTTMGVQPMMGTGGAVPGMVMGTQQIPGQMIPGQIMPGQMMPDQTMGGQQIPGQIMPGQIMPAQAAPNQAMPVMETEYTQGYLKTQIGRRVKVDFLIGTNMLIDREGILVDVGISYIVLNETDTDDLLLCDIYSIKFVRFYY